MSYDSEKTIKINTLEGEVSQPQQPSRAGGTIRMTGTRRFIQPSLKKRSTNLQAMTPELLKQYEARRDAKRVCKCRHHLTIHKDGKCTVCKDRCPGYRERDDDDICTTDNMEEPSTRELIEELRNKK